MKKEFKKKEIRSNVVETVVEPKNDWLHNPYTPFLAIIILVFIAYANTLTLEYALDDRLLITENQFTKKGATGIPEILTNDAFTGFFGTKKTLVAGGRYRPLTQVMFALEYQIFGLNPFIGHLINLILYTLLCVLLFAILRKLFQFDGKRKWYFSLAFLSTIIFALHPIHTEVVANIKGRDEIISLLGALAALWFALKFVQEQKMIHLLWIFFVFLLGLFSKENALTFIAVIPLTLFFFNNSKLRDLAFVLFPMLIAGALFLVVRQMAVGSILNTEIVPEILNNPFLNVDKSSEIATVIYTWFVYLKLMVFPHPLTHDYYPFQIPYFQFSNPIIIVLTIFFIGIGIWSIFKFFKKSLFAWAIMISVATFSVQSNLLFNLGTFMNERFLFAPSIGLSVLIAMLFMFLYDKFKNKRIIEVIFVVLILGYSAKTISRNMVWKNDRTLFRTDVKVSNNSIKCNVSAGGVSVEMAREAKSAEEKVKLIKEGLEYLSKAQKLHPKSFFAWFLAGNAYSELQNWEMAIFNLKNAVSINFESKEANNNLLYNAQQAFNKGQYVASADAYQHLLKFQPDNIDYQINLAHALSYSNQADSAMRMLDRILMKNPSEAKVYAKKGEIYGRVYNDLNNSELNLRKAISLNPNDLSSNENLGIVLGMKGQFAESLGFFFKALEIDSSQSRIYMNISGTYKYMGNKEKEIEYAQKAQLIMSGK